MSHTRDFYGGLSRWAQSLINILAFLTSQENGNKVKISQLALFSNQPSSKNPTRVTSPGKKTFLLPRKLSFRRPVSGTGVKEYIKNTY